MTNAAEPDAVRGDGWRKVLGSALTHMERDRITVSAGAFAYRWFLSIFPTIIALLGICSLVGMPRSLSINLIHGAERALPPAAAHVFTTAINQAADRTSRNLIATLVALLIALWSAVAGMIIVEQGLGAAFGVAQDRSFLAKRRTGFLLFVAAIVLGGGASALVVFGSPIAKAIKHDAPISGAAFESIWGVIRWVIALVFINALLTTLYRFAPNRELPRWRWTSSGAVVATVLWAIVSFGFSLYTSNFSSYNNTYGAFAGVAILIFWLYLTGLAIFIGGEIDAAHERSAVGGT